MNQDIRTFIALGSNIAPLEQVSLGLLALSRLPASRLGAVSSWYLSQPWGFEDQPEFINLVAELWTRLSPQGLLAELQTIEERSGRIRTRPNGPRTLDLDLLLYGDEILDEPGLRIPHSGLLVRDFMLLPLIEIAPDAIHPEEGRPVAKLQDRILYHQIICRIRDRA
ncbi:2-amino-4-hydroxy-6-hydroxymethyldihydropteridine diphosphokinase [Caldichromatium japonicum]|uniref:2-amino-4-hydroxy-6-hydroxymethyldihydropteridine pyrophosphokinase n=1 Tax=Caldichromatium japonicum TaxID=2699430 RepID=A0A6G7VDF2_9GAMM|nr:2-amino-4-hydroxy-6-hydroxymethyldihydropteridine diphosphokinase [Caldichromatium japonicum]QIK38079.1 2-amino-4-hydroxy-6-hydroxymethyldihydropteridine diphosphokinase [Caldichromatium japonicum]